MLGIGILGKDAEEVGKDAEAGNLRLLQHRLSEATTAVRDSRSNFVEVTFFVEEPCRNGI